MIKKLLAILTLIACTLSPALAQILIPPPPNIAARSWLLLDASSQQVLAAREAGTRIEPASLVKLMTAYLTFAALRDKQLSLDQVVTVSAHVLKIDRGSSKMFLEPNQRVSIDDLLYGLIPISGNDAAIALAEAISGTTEAFVALMNHEAQRQGLTETHYSNPHGLPSPGTYTTAHDLSILCRNLITDFPAFYKRYYAVKQFNYNHITQLNRNRLLWLDPTVDGMKTGHTDSSGYSLITAARRPMAHGERRLISIVIGANSDQVRAQESQKLLNWGFQNFVTVKLYDQGQTVDRSKVWKGSKSTINIGFAHDIYATVPKTELSKLKTRLERNDPLIAPLAKNTTVGTLKVMVGDHMMTQLPLVALESVQPASMLGRAWDSLWLLLRGNKT